MQLALAYSWVVGPSIVGAAVVLDEMILLIGMVPIFFANRFVYRRWPYLDPEERERDADRVFAGTSDDDLPAEDSTRLEDLGFIFDHPGLVDRMRYPTRVALVTRIGASVCSVAGFSLLLLAVPDIPWLGALGAFLVLGASGPTARHLAFLLAPRFPTAATDDDRRRWLRYHRIVEVVGWTALFALAMFVMAGLI